MGKTAQRKRSAYQSGYQVGRHGWPRCVNCFRVGMVAEGAWKRGLADGRRDRMIAAGLVERSWLRRVIDWLLGLKECRN